MKDKYILTTKSSILANGNITWLCILPGIHEVLKLLSLGHNRNRVHLVREVRWNRLTRDQALNIEYSYLKISRSMKALKVFCEYLGIKMNALRAIMKSYTNPNYWGWEDKNLYYKERRK